MHLADGILTDPRIVVGLDLVGGGALAIAARRMESASGRQTAWTGLFGAFVLAAQAINVPLMLGTSAHVIGAGLATLVLGPARAIVTLAGVLVVQALLLGDGGLTVLGINVLNLAVLPALSVELAARVFGRTQGGLRSVAIVGTVLGNVAGASVLAAALVAGLKVSPGVTFGWLVSVQALAGLGEGILTAIAVGELDRRASGLLYRTGGSPGQPALSRAVLAWSVIAVGAATAAVPLASSAPDALEHLLSGVSASGGALR